MKNFFRKIGYKFQRFMSGRYGIDSLWTALSVLYLITVVAANILYRFSKISYYALLIMSIVLIIYTLFRAFSKNIEERRKENERWLEFKNKFTGFFKFQNTKFKQRKTHKFVKCKSCKKTLRLPRNKGKIKVTCPHCKNQFIVNTGKKSA